MDDFAFVVGGARTIIAELEARAKNAEGEVYALERILHETLLDPDDGDNDQVLDHWVNPQEAPENCYCNTCYFRKGYMR